MRIGLDVGSALAAGSGISFYVENLLAGLDAAGREHEFTLYSAFWSGAERLARLRAPARFAKVHFRVPQRLVLPLDEAGAGLQRRRLARLNLDVFHGLGHILPPLGRLPTVVTVHHVGGISDRATAWERWYLGPLTTASVRRATRVIAVSEWSRKAAIALWDLDPARVAAVHEGGPDAAFKPAASTRTGRPYLLHVGSFQVHKNIPLAVRAFARWLKADPARTERLILVGRPGRDSAAVAALVAQLGLGGRVELRPGCPQGELVSLYQGASMVLVPSRVEGFGFPVLEAMACGVPALVSTAAALPEVAGDAAVLLDPDDEAGWAAALARVAGDAAQAAELRAKGLSRVKSFSWLAAARATLAVHRAAVDGH